MLLGIHLCLHGEWEFCVVEGRTAKEVLCGWGVHMLEATNVSGKFDSCIKE